MALSSVSIVLGNGGIGNAPTNTDYIRGLQLYGTAPGSFATTACQAVTSLADAVAKGIALDYADETAAKGIVTISGSLTAGDTLTIKVTEPLPNGTSKVVTLGTGTAPATPTATTFAAAVVAAINALTYSHGYTATNSSGAITITAKQGLGIALNSGTPISLTTTGSGTFTITQQFGTGSGGATTGVYSQKAVWYYHVSEFFRLQPNGKLWINFASSPTSNFAEVTDLITKSNGECLLVGVYSFTARTAAQVAADLTVLQAVADSAFAAYNYAAISYCPNIAAISDVSTLYNLQTYTNKFTTCLIAQDGKAKGAQLYVNTGVSIGAIGALLGVSSKSATSQNIGEILTNNISDGTEYDTPAYTNGVLINTTSSSFQTSLDAYRYVFMEKRTRVAGTWFTNDWTAVSTTNDYNRLSRVIPILKAAQGVYAGVVRYIKSRLFLKSDGTLTDDAINVFKSAIAPYLDAMVGVDISDYVTYIDPAQNVLTTNSIAIVVRIVPVGMADFINVTLTYTTKI